MALITHAQPLGLPWRSAPTPAKHALPRAARGCFHGAPVIVCYNRHLGHETPVCLFRRLAPSLLQSPPMKKTDLYKNLALKIENQMKQAGTPDRFAQGEVLDRKAQRKLDQSQGLIPFAVKLNQDLVNELRTLASQRDVELNTLVAELLRKGLAAEA